MGFENPVGIGQQPRVFGKSNFFMLANFFHFFFKMETLILKQSVHVLYFFFIYVL